MRLPLPLFPAALVTALAALLVAELVLGALGALDLETTAMLFRHMPSFGLVADTKKEATRKPSLVSSRPLGLQRSKERISVR